MLAHEIRTPLNGILALSELIATADLPEREREWAAPVKGAAEHLAALATLVVDGVRAETRGLVLREEPYSACVRWREAVGGALAARAEAKGLAADVTIARGPAGAGDRRSRAAARGAGEPRRQCGEIHRARPCRIVGGSGARAARPPSAQLHDHRQRCRAVKARRDRETVPAVRQANAAVARRFGGSGLGLVFAKRLAQAMEGKLTVEEPRRGGSTFTLQRLRSARPTIARSLARARMARGLRARGPCTCCAPRTIPTRASCSTRS